MAVMTTSLEVLAGGRAESLTEAVARRLRGQLAERRISGLRLAQLTGLGRSTIDRRLRGETALNTDELELIEQKTGISAVYLLTGRHEEGPRPDPGEGLHVRHQGLEPRTRWLSAHRPDLHECGTVRRLSVIPAPAPRPTLVPVPARAVA